MPLKFPPVWRFESPGVIPEQVSREFYDLVSKITTQGSAQDIVEGFKKRFAAAAGDTMSGWSSSLSWAYTDLSSAMDNATTNAPMFIEAFYDGCLEVEQAGMAAPNVALINRILAKHEAGYEIRVPELLATRELSYPADLAQPKLSIDKQARDLIDKSLQRSGELLVEGRYRPAVQEVLWLLETVTTAFQGMDTNNGTIQGDYFNKIVSDLRAKSRGTTLALVLEWCRTLHGYLSSPTGGGIRHGALLLEAEVDLPPHEATLYCTLTRGYIFYLLAEHTRLSEQTAGRS